MTTTTARLGTRMRDTRDVRGLSIAGAAAQARVSARLWDAVETFGAHICTETTLIRLHAWLDR